MCKRAVWLGGLAPAARAVRCLGARADATGRGNNLTDLGTVSSAPGHIGSAAVFTRDYNEYLSHADNADLSQGNNDFTVAGWLYLHAEPPEIWGQDTASFFTK